MHADAVIFDLDGTLTDSNGVFLDAVRDALKTMGAELSLEDYNLWHGVHGSWTDLLDSLRLPRERLDDLTTISSAAFERRLREDARWVEGAEETLRALHGRFPLGLVTNSRHIFIDALEHSLRLREWFAVIVTADEMGDRVKPDPYGLQIAAKALGAPPERCLFIGDQRFDMLAAEAAGMHGCLYLGPHTGPDAQLVAKSTVRSMREVPGLLAD